MTTNSVPVLFNCSRRASTEFDNNCRSFGTTMATSTVSHLAVASQLQELRPWLLLHWRLCSAISIGSRFFPFVQILCPQNPKESILLWRLCRMNHSSMSGHFSLKINSSLSLSAVVRLLLHRQFWCIFFGCRHTE
eukprot:Gb_01359 [translate_table: standard]